MRAGNPFLDAEQVRGVLYGAPDRLAKRTSALISARVSGRPVNEVLGEMVRDRLPVPVTQARLLDVGCGRGSTSRALANLSPNALVAVDLSPALAAATSHRLAASGKRHAIAADFHRLSFTSECFDVAVAAFCLYHADHPSHVIAEIARCLRPGGVFIAVTKSLDSYSELDAVLERSSLLPDQGEWPRLYETAHSRNIGELAAAALDVVEVRHDVHCFRFVDLEHLAAYLVTTPRYPLPDRLRDDPRRLAGELRSRLGQGSVEASSTVTYLVGVRRA